MARSFWFTSVRWVLAVACLLIVRPVSAAAEGGIRGTVLDQLGGSVSGAQVTVIRDGQQGKAVTTDPTGAFVVEGLAEGRYQILVVAAGFSPQTTDPVFVASTGRVTVAVRLQISPIQDSVLVTAAASDVTGAQTGASATVIDSTLIDALGNTDLLEPLRSVPGVAIVQTGGRGASASLFVRGGASNFNKVLVDGVPANDIGGAFDVSDVATAGVDRVEVLRGSNSVIFGTDAMASVVNITTRQGRTRVPEAIFSIDGGNFATSHEETSIGGAAKRVDYFGAFSHLQTDNDVENSDYRNDTFAGRIGVVVGSNTRLTGTLRWVDTDLGSPNATNFYGISDDSRLDKQNLYTAISAETQISDRWQSRITFGLTDQDYLYNNPSPTGTRSDPSDFANYLGDVVTITSAAGGSVTGRAILDYGGEYPSPYHATVSRSILNGRTDYRVSPALNIGGGARVEHESGTNEPSYSTTDDDLEKDIATRTNYGAFVEARAAALERLFITAGVGVDNNETYGAAVVPRVSVAAYLRPPSSAMLGDTKVTFNAGKGVKAPSVSQELSSLFELVPNLAEPVAPEYSRTVDIGVEQGLAGGRARVRVTYFDNEFKDLIEFVSKNNLPGLGVPPAIVAATGFGAYVNGQSNTSKGVEVSGDVVTGPVKVMASYTYADAIVTESFGAGASAFQPENPAFPGIPIGQYSPLVGNRPFRRPANSGSFVVTYTREKASVGFGGYFFGKADDSTYLTDAFFGYSMLLPNQDMAAAYQKFDVSGSYRFHPRIRGYVTVENLSGETFAAASGYPALPRAVRAGATFIFGGN